MRRLTSALVFALLFLGPQTLDAQSAPCGEVCDANAICIPTGGGGYSGCSMTEQGCLLTGSCEVKMTRHGTVLMYAALDGAARADSGYFLRGSLVDSAIDENAMDSCLQPHDSVSPRHEATVVALADGLGREPSIVLAGFDGAR